MRPVVLLLSRLASLACCALCAIRSGTAQETDPGPPELNGAIPKTDTIYLLPGDFTYNGNLNFGNVSVAIASNGNVILGYEDDLTPNSRDDASPYDVRGGWTIFNANGFPVTPFTEVHSLVTGETQQTRVLAFFRQDKSPTPATSAMLPVVKANQFGEGVGMGASAFMGDPQRVGFNNELPEFANFGAGDGGTFPVVQLLSNDGQPAGIVTGVPSDYASRPGDITLDDWEYLANGNIVILSLSNQESDLVDIYGWAAAAPHLIYRVVKPDGTELHPVALVSDDSQKTNIVPQRSGAGALSVSPGGFMVRTIEPLSKIRIFNNDGTPQTGTLETLPQAPDPIPPAGAYLDAHEATTHAFLTVFNENGSERYSRVVSDDVQTGTRSTAAAMDHLGRVFVVYTAGGADFSSITAGRIFDPNGTPLGGTFYVSENELPSPFTLFSVKPRVAFRGELAAVAWESNNSSAAVPVVAFRVFTVPTPALLSVSQSGGDVTVTWDASGFTLQTAPEITGPWSDAGASGTGFTAPAGEPRRFYRLYKP